MLVVLRVEDIEVIVTVDRFCCRTLDTALSTQGLAAIIDVLLVRIILLRQTRTGRLGLSHSRRTNQTQSVPVRFTRYSQKSGARQIHYHLRNYVLALLPHPLKLAHI